MANILKKFGQESTWRGLITIVTAVGVVLNPEQIEAIVAAGLSVVGLINIFKND